MPTIKPNDYMRAANNSNNIATLIRYNPKQFKSNLEKVNAANALLSLSKSSRKRKRSSGKTIKKRKSKRRKTRLGRK
tara:strand:+ start:1362 stop:1592 length:231 start_codon:yes stop_codon:yes gene_type:complete